MQMTPPKTNSNTLPEKEFIKHACEQVLRFTRARTWGELREERKVQLGFNMGVMALGLGLSKEEGFIALSDVREGRISMEKFHENIEEIVLSKGIDVDRGKVEREF